MLLFGMQTTLNVQSSRTRSYLLLVSNVPFHSFWTFTKQYIIIIIQLSPRGPLYNMFRSQRQYLTSRECERYVSYHQSEIFLLVSNISLRGLEEIK